MSEDHELGAEARWDMIAAAQKHVDQWRAHEGALLTGLVVIMEFATPEEGQSQVLTYSATDGNGEGLPVHRILGMVNDVGNELLVAMILHRASQQRDQD